MTEINKTVSEKLKKLKTEKREVKWKRLSQTQLIATGFLFIILIGTFLLMLPISSREGEVTSFFDAMLVA